MSLRVLGSMAHSVKRDNALSEPIVMRTRAETVSLLSNCKLKGLMLSFLLAFVQGATPAVAQSDAAAGPAPEASEQEAPREERQPGGSSHAEVGGTHNAEPAQETSSGEGLTEDLRRSCASCNTATPLTPLGQRLSTSISRCPCEQAAGDAAILARRTARQVREHTYGRLAMQSRSYPRSTERYPESSPYRQLGDYEWSLVRPVLQERGALPAHEAEGRTICHIDYVPRDIFLPDEPFPLWLNGVHSTTRVSTLLSATPIQVGQTYSTILIEDAEVELRDPTVYSAVVIVPVLSPVSDCVNLYVVTRDLWSLRAALDPQISGGVLEFLALSLQETNFLGLNDTLGVNFVLEQGSFEIGPQWISDWFLNRDLLVSEEFRMIFDRENGGFDGTMNRLEIRRPLRSSYSTDAWFLRGEHRVATGRVFNGRSINEVRVEDPVTGENYLVEERWGDVDLRFSAGYTRSYGLNFKHNLTMGPFLRLREVDPRPNDDAIPERVLETFVEDRLPREERAVGLQLEYRFFENRYFYLVNYDNFAVAEPYRSGVNGVATLEYSEPGIGANTRYVELYGALAYLLPLGDDAMLQVGLGQGARLSSGFSDVRTQGSARLVLPFGWIGRFSVRGWARRIHENAANDIFRLGAATNFRGYSGYVVEGDNAWLLNTEWRSGPVEVLSLYFGLAAFADIGSAWSGPRGEAGVYGTVGLGLRFLVPQGMARPGSVDFGFPVGNGTWSRGFPAPVISLRFGQAYSGVGSVFRDEFSL